MQRQQTLIYKSIISSDHSSASDQMTQFSTNSNISEHWRSTDTSCTPQQWHNKRGGRGGTVYPQRLSTREFFATNTEKWGREKRSKIENVEENWEKLKREGENEENMKKRKKMRNVRGKEDWKKLRIFFFFWFVLFLLFAFHFKETTETFLGLPKWAILPRKG